jgi:hypothetical protein
VHSGSLRAVLEMGVFDALPQDGSSATASTLAEKLGAEKDILGRFGLSSIILFGNWSADWEQ